MKSRFYYLLLFISSFIAAQCGYNYDVTFVPDMPYRKPNIFAVDFTIPANTTLSFNSAKFKVNYRSHGNVTNATVYLYEDNNGQPGTLISTYDISNVITSSIHATNTQASVDLNIPLSGITAANTTTSPKKIWFGYKIQVPDSYYVSVYSYYKEMYTYSGNISDGTPMMYLNATTNSWEVLNPYLDAIIEISANCSLLNVIEASDINKYIVFDRVTNYLIINKDGFKSVEILDAAGRKVLRKINSERSIDLSDLKNGVYFVKVFFENDKDFLTQKILKQK